MTNIFDFPSRKKSTLNSDFLRDADDTVEFGPSGRDVKLRDNAIGRMLSHPPFACRDWNNQELANIYRVKKLLDAAGVPNTLQRGLSDEGDPWCVFCTVTGEVFIHLCKIDGQYVLDSPNLRAPIAGRDFAGLVDAFSLGALRCTTGSTKHGNPQVVKLQPTGKVLLHPAVLLAALIWSIYLNSDDLLMFSPEADLDEVDESDGIALVAETVQGPLTDAEAAEAAQFMQHTALSEHPAGARSSDDLREGMIWKDMLGKSGMVLAPTPMAVGLSSIAIAFGIMSDSFFEAEPNADLAAIDTLSHESHQTSVSDMDPRIGAEGPQRPFDLAYLLEEAGFDHPVFEDPARAALKARLEGEIDTDIIPVTAPQPKLAELVLKLAASFEDNWIEDIPEEITSSPDTLLIRQVVQKVETPEASPSESAPAAIAELAAPPAPTPPVPSFDYASLFDFRSSFTANFETFDIAGITVEATFDVSATDLVTSDLIRSPAFTGSISQPTSAFSDSIAEPDALDLAEVATVFEDEMNFAPASYQPATAPSSPFELIDLNAQRFINFLMTREQDLEVLAFGQELVLIDFAAFEGNPGATFTKSWSLADGGTISTVGLKSDFIQFDLIA